MTNNETIRRRAAVLRLRLKQRKVLTVPGEDFFFGVEESWFHRQECLRLNFAQPAEVVREGLEIIAGEAALVRKWKPAA